MQQKLLAVMTCVGGSGAAAYLGVCAAHVGAPHTLVESYLGTSCNIVVVNCSYRLRDQLIRQGAGHAQLIERSVSKAIKTPPELQLVPHAAVQQERHHRRHRQAIELYI